MGVRFTLALKSTDAGVVNGGDSSSPDFKIARVRIPFGASIHSSVVECDSSKVVTRVRFPLNAYVGAKAFRYVLKTELFILIR